MPIQTSLQCMETRKTGLETHKINNNMTTINKIDNVTIHSTNNTAAQCQVKRQQATRKETPHCSSVHRLDF